MDDLTKEIAAAVKEELLGIPARTLETGSLSPITEVEEHFANENLFSTEKEEVNTSMLDNTLYTTTLDLSNTTLTSEEPVDFSQGVKPPVTPPEVLRERLNKLKCDYEYLATEHEELAEYSKLERQLCHSECVSQDRIKQQTNQLESLFSSVESLKNENQNLFTSLCQKNAEVERLEEKLATITETTNNLSNIISLKLSSILKQGCKEPVQNNSFFDHILNNNGIENRKMAFSNRLENKVQNLLNLIECVVVHHFQTQTSLEQSKLEKQKLQEEKEKIDVVTKKQQKELSCLKTENLRLQEIIDCSKNEVNEMAKKQIASQVDFKNLRKSLNKETKYVTQLKKQLENIVTLDDIQEDLQTIFRELNVCLEGVSCIKDLKTCFNSLSSNPNLIASVNMIMNDSSQMVLCKVMDTVVDILRVTDADVDISKSNLNELNQRIAVLEQETNYLKHAISQISLEVSENINRRVSAIENQMKSKENIYKQDQLRLACLEEETTELNRMVIELKTKLQVTEDQLKLSNSAKNKIEKEVQNFKRVATVAGHENCQQVLRTFSDILGNCNDSNSLKDCLTRIKESKELLTCVNPFLDQQTHETFLLFLQHLIEKTYCLYIENESLQESNLAQDKNDDRPLSDMSSLNETISQSEKESCHYCLEELKELRELIATEIENLDQEDLRKDLLNYSSRDIFTKLMQNIMNKETEFKDDMEKRYQEDLHKAKTDVEESKNKRKSQEFWVVELQNENDMLNTELTTLKTVKVELDRKIKMLFNDLKAADSEISSLRSKNTEIIVEKDTLLTEVTHLKKSLKTEIDQCENLKANLEKMSAEHSKCLSSSNCKEDNLERRETLFIKCDNFDKVDAEYGLNSEYANCNNSQTGQKNGSITPRNKKSKTEFANFMAYLEKERGFLTEVINDIDNESLGENLLAITDNLTCSREIVKLLGERFVKIEQTHNSNLSEFHNDIDNLKSSIVTLYECIATDNPVFESPEVTNGFAVKVGNELEFIKDECILIQNTSRNIEQTALHGTMFIQKLKDEFHKVKREAVQKEVRIKELEKTALSERSKMLEQEKETEQVKTKLNNIVLENSILLKQVNQLSVQVNEANLKISNLGINFPSNINDLGSKLNHFVKIYGNEMKNLRSKLEENEQNAEFLAYHLRLILPHLNQVETNSTAVHNVSKSQCREVQNLKQMLSVKETELNESYLLLNQIFSALPMKVTAPAQAVEVINYVVSLLRQAEETNNKLKDELQSLNSVSKLNSNLNLQLSEFEEQIRSLRSELRSLRMKYQREVIEKRKCRSVNTITQEIQTDAGCCKSITEQLEKKLASQGLVITDLKLQIAHSGRPYQEKIKQLEHSLKHAKERIGMLNHQLIQQKNYVKGLVEQQGLQGASGDNSPQNNF